MGKARSMARKKKHDDALMKRIKTCENGGVSAWSDLTHDVLFPVMMRLGVVDFFAFSGVCKPWRSLALINRNKFIVSRPPMSISFSNDSNKCYLEDFEGRKFSTILPHSAGRRCIGVTRGYLILARRYDIWLVNPITRHELCFPDVPGDLFCCYGYDDYTCFLVFSPLISRWVFAVRRFNCNPTSYISIAGTREWRSNIRECHLHAFNGNIYALDSIYKMVVHELRLDPELELVLVENARFRLPNFTRPQFVTSGKNLYVIDMDSKHPDMNIHELDFGKMKCVSCKNTGEKYAFFRDKFQQNATITLGEVWADIRSQYERYVFSNRNGKGMLEANLWYIFQDCLNANTIHE